MMSTATGLAAILDNWAGADVPRIAIAEILKIIARASAEMSKAIAQYDLLEIESLGGNHNSDGDSVKPLDIFAHQVYARALAQAPAAFLVSEEMETPIEINRSATYGIALDPLDGSSNIETNLTIGTIFSVLEANLDELPDICPGERQRAAGFVCYGPQTRMVLTLGEGSWMFLLDPENGEFRSVGEALAIPSDRCEFAINVSNYRFWEPSVRNFIDDCIAGESGNLGRDFNMRWNASLVADAFRIIVRGGVFLYPGDARPGYADGRLRLLYEAAPMAMIVEQAGGSASDGRERILDLRLESLHRRVPLVFGSSDRVDEVFDYVSGTAFQATRFPLFEQRGLLRS